MTRKGFMKLYFTLICILLTIIGCKKDSNEVTTDYAYLGGEIINPNTNYIVLSKNEVILDTVKLDGRNRFLYKIDELNEGLYTFRHGGEFQLILLEPKDSLLFRLNTLDFDESLVYSGIGDKKNNYLKLLPYTWRLIELRLNNPIFSRLIMLLKDCVSLKMRKKIKFYAN